MQISQIFISDDDKGLPPRVLANTASVQINFPDYDYKLYDLRAIEDFLAAHYSEDVQWAFRTLQPFAYKADLARYAILNVTGGWYIDLGFKWLQNISLSSEITLLGFRDRQDVCCSSWGAYNGVIYSIKGHPALQTAIQMIVDNCKSKYYGITPMCPTGPNLWGKAIAQSARINTILLGDFCELTPRHKFKNIALLMPDGVIAAFYKPGIAGDPGRLNKLIPSGVNDYNWYWQNKNVYGEKHV